MQLIFKKDIEWEFDGTLFLTSGEQNSPSFRILADVEFQDLSAFNLESLKFFIDEANERLE